MTETNKMEVMLLSIFKNVSQNFKDFDHTVYEICDIHIKKHENFGFWPVSSKKDGQKSLNFAHGFSMLSTT